jgi:hypothetical protein
MTIQKRQPEPKHGAYSKHRVDAKCRSLHILMQTMSINLDFFDPRPRRRSFSKEEEPLYDFTESRPDDVTVEKWDQLRLKHDSNIVLGKCMCHPIRASI